MNLFINKKFKCIINTLLFASTTLLLTCNSINVNALSITSNNLSAINDIFKDNLLANSIATSLHKTIISQISQNDLNSITNLDIPAGLNNLDGVEYLNNLQSIYIGNSNIEDLSNLSQLTNLSKLSLINCNISDLSPLVTLKNLNYLNLFSNSISDLKPLSSLQNLTYIVLNQNNITDISPLSSLVKLTDLEISNSKIRNLSPLSQLYKLQQLLLSSNNIDDISPLASLTNITNLILDNNHIINISPLSNLNKLTHISVSNQSLASPAVEISSHIIVKNIVKSIDNNYIAPSSVSNSGTYSSTNIIWTSATSSNSFSYSFNKSFYIGNTNGNFSGIVTQPIYYTSAPILTGQAHVQRLGWMSVQNNDRGILQIGTVGQSLRIEALKLKLSGLPDNAYIKYQVQVQNIGWMAPVTNGALSGTTGKSLRIESIKIQLVNAPIGYHVEYQSQVQNIGWMPWCRDGSISGTVRKSLRMETIRIKLVKDFENTGVNYNTQLSSYGWTTYSSNTAFSGQPQFARSIESFTLNPQNISDIPCITYSSCNIDGWGNTVSNGLVSGTVGKSKPLYSIKANINSNTKTIQYEVYNWGIGWSNWGSNGEVVGDAKRVFPIIAIRCRIVNNSDASTLPSAVQLNVPKYIYNNISTHGHLG